MINILVVQCSQLGPILCAGVQRGQMDEDFKIQARSRRLLGHGKELTFPLRPLCTPITPTQAYLVIYEIGIITIFVGSEKAKWRKMTTRLLWKNNKWKRKPASCWSR